MISSSSKSSISSTSIALPSTRRTLFPSFRGPIETIASLKKIYIKNLKLNNTSSSGSPASLLFLREAQSNWSQVLPSVVKQIRTRQWRCTFGSSTNLNTFDSQRLVLLTPFVIKSTSARFPASSSTQLDNFVNFFKTENILTSPE